MTSPDEFDVLVFTTPDEGIEYILISVLGVEDGNIKDLVAKACIEYRKLLFIVLFFIIRILGAGKGSFVLYLA